MTDVLLTDDKLLRDTLIEQREHDVVRLLIWHRWLWLAGLLLGSRARKRIGGDPCPS